MTSAEPVAARRGAHLARRPLRRWRWPAAAVALLVVVTIGALVLEFRDAVSTVADLANPVVAHQYHVNLAQFSCLQDEVTREVTRGASVDIGPVSGPHYLSLIEAVTPWAMPTSSGRATFTLTLSPGPCYGLGIVVRRP